MNKQPTMLRGMRISALTTAEIWKVYKQGCSDVTHGWNCWKCTITFVYVFFWRLVYELLHK